MSIVGSQTEAEADYVRPLKQWPPLLLQNGKILIIASVVPDRYKRGTGSARELIVSLAQPTRSLQSRPQRSRDSQLQSGVFIQPVLHHLGCNQCMIAGSIDLPVPAFILVINEMASGGTRSLPDQRQRCIAQHSILYTIFCTDRDSLISSARTRTDKGMEDQAVKQIEAPSLVDRLVERIREDIVSGELAPGAHIKIKRIADSHGISMIPVREALARLLASRLVRVEANRGYFVTCRPTPAEYAELVKARELIETSALAAGFHNLTEADVRSLNSLNERMRKLATAPRRKRNMPMEWGALNTEFHRILVGSFRNSYFDSIFTDLSLESSMARPFASEPPPFADLVDQHDAIIDAIKASDLKLAIKELSHHINSLSIKA